MLKAEERKKQDELSKLKIKEVLKSKPLYRKFEEHFKNDVESITLENRKK